MSDADLLGTKVGHIRIVDLLDHGGMGSVFVGYDEKLDRRVALKSILEGRLDAAARARFQREARVLSQLRHPNICQIHDYIEGEKRDFLVLELLEGRSLKALLQTRLDDATKTRVAEDIVQVLIASHEKGIIHRDLKPSNVMLANDGTVKVLDFGLARADDLALSSAETLTSHAVATSEQAKGSDYAVTKLGVVVGTLLYMSPEQARGEPVATASDMYSFGLLLQELYTGQPPYEAALAPDALLEKARAGDTLPVTGLAPDLTALINRLKSLAPASRPSAVDTADHLRRIRERPRRRLRRLLRTAALVLLAVVAAVMSFQAYRIRQEAERANQALEQAHREAEAATQVSDFLVKLFRVSDPSESRGNTVTAREILDKGAASISEDLKDQPELQARLMLTMGDVYIGLGLTKEAQPLLDESLATYRRVLGPDHPDTLEANNKMGALLLAEGDYAGAAERFRGCFDSWRRLYGSEDTRTLRAMNNLAAAAYGVGDFEETESILREVLAIRRRTLGEHDPQTLLSLQNHAAALHVLGRYAEAEDAYRQALLLMRQVQRGKHPDTLACVFNLAVALHAQGRLAEARVQFQEALDDQRQVLGYDHPDTLTTERSLGELDLDAGRIEDAESTLRDVLERQRRVHPPGHPEVADTLIYLADSLLRGEQYHDAEELLREAHAINQHARPEHWLANETRCLLAEALAGQGMYEESERLLIRGCRGVLESSEPSRAVRDATRERASRIYEAWGKPEKAAQWLGKTPAG